MEDAADRAPEATAGEAAGDRPIPALPASEAIPRLLDEHGNKIYGLGLRVCHGPAEAEDLVQETFLRAFQHWDQFEGRSQPSSWLYTIALRLCRRMHRKRSGEPREMEPLADLLPGGDEVVPEPPENDDPLDAQLRRETRERVQRGLAHLPLDFRLPLMLKDIAELKIAEIAEILGLKEATVKTRIHRARLKLRQVLAEGFPEPEEPRHRHESRQVCLDLLRAKQEALDRGVELPVSARELCDRCSAVFRTLDLARDICLELGRGEMPEEVRRLLEREMGRSGGGNG